MWSFPNRAIPNTLLELFATITPPGKSADRGHRDSSFWYSQFEVVHYLVWGQPLLNTGLLEVGTGCRFFVVVNFNSNYKFINSNSGIDPMNVC